MQVRKEITLQNDRATLDDVVGEPILAVRQLFALLDNQSSR